MSLKKFSNKLKKREFLEILKYEVKKLTNLFGYTKSPKLFETTYDDGTFMCYYQENNKNFRIGYDYVNFKKAFDRDRLDEQCCCAVAIISHEMRHYYQYRQLFSKTPFEEIKTLKNWASDTMVKKEKKIKTGFDKYAFSSREIDAFAFGYAYASRKFGIAPLKLFYSYDHYLEVKKRYKKTKLKLGKFFFSKTINKAIKRSYKKKTA